MDNSEFVRSIENATLKIVQDTAVHMKKACLVVERDAKINCPVDMGVLRASITSDVMIDISGIEGVIGSNLAYAPYVHNGTGIYAINGDGRKTPWVYKTPKGTFYTEGQKAVPFLEYAKIFNMDKIERILGGKS